MACMNDYPSVDTFTQEEKETFLENAKVLATGSKVQGDPAETANIPLNEIVSTPVEADDDTIINTDGVLSVAVPVPEVPQNKVGAVLTIISDDGGIDWENPIRYYPGTGLDTSSGVDSLTFHVKVPVPDPKSNANPGDVLTYDGEDVVWAAPQGGGIELPNVEPITQSAGEYYIPIFVNPGTYAGQSEGYTEKTLAWIKTSQLNGRFDFPWTNN